MSSTDVSPAAATTGEADHHKDLEKQELAFDNNRDSNSKPDEATTANESDSQKESQDAPPRALPPGAKAGLTVSQFWLALLGMNLGMLLTALDFNIVATAVPIISSEFNDYSSSAWLGDGFLITFALVLPVTAKLGDVFGRKDIFLVCTVIFAVGSAMCGWSTTMDMLIGSRAVQGIGAGGIYGLVNVILTDLVDLQDVGKYMAVTGIVWVLADVAGPLLGGAFAEYATWRWCFWINLCIAPISFLVVLIVLQLPRTSGNVVQKLRNFDYAGTLFISGGTVSIVMALAWGGNAFPWGDSRVIGMLVGGVAIFAALIVAEHFAKDPLIFPAFFKSRTLLAIFGAEFMYGMVLLGCMYYVPQFFQLIFGDTATLAGVGLLPMMLGLAVGNPIAAWITSKFGVTLINAIVGACFQVLATGLMTRWNAQTTRAEAVILLIVLGMGQGAVMSALLLSAQVAVQPMQIGVVTGLAIFVQILGNTFGIATFAAVYVNRLAGLLNQMGLAPDQVSLVLSNVEGIRGAFSPELVPRIVDVYARSLQNGWWLMFACSVALLLFTCLSRQHKFAPRETS